MTPRDPRHRIGLHHSNHLIDVMDTWPATRRRRFPFGLRRDPLKGWMVSDEALAHAEKQAKIEGPVEHFSTHLVTHHIDENGTKWKVAEEFIKGIADWKATQYAEYRIKRGYVSTDAQRAGMPVKGADHG